MVAVVSATTIRGASGGDGGGMTGGSGDGGGMTGGSGDGGGGTGGGGLLIEAEVVGRHSV